MPLKGSFNSENKPTKKETKPVQTQTKSEQEDPCANVKHDINKFSVTYNKINDPSKMYGEDNTQDCCLSPEQMDANFNFLHGDDIKNGRFDPDKKMLVLDRHFAGKDMAKYGKTHPAIGPIKISTEEILSGTTFDKEDGVLHINFNGNDTQIPGFNEYCDDLAEKIREIQEEIAKNGNYAAIYLSPSVGFRGENNNVTVLSKLENISGTDPGNYISNVIKNADGEIIAENTRAKQLSTSVTGITANTSFSTIIIYPIDTTHTVEFTTSKYFYTYNHIKLGTEEVETEEEFIHNDPGGARGSAKNSFYLIELPNETDEFYLEILIPQDVYEGNYHFYYNGYGIEFIEEREPVYIDNVKYHVFKSGGKYKYDSINKGEFNIEIR